MKNFPENNEQEVQLLKKSYCPMDLHTYRNPVALVHRIFVILTYLFSYKNHKKCNFRDVELWLFMVEKTWKRESDQWRNLNPVKKIS